MAVGSECHEVCFDIISSKTNNALTLPSSKYLYVLENANEYKWVTCTVKHAFDKVPGKGSFVSV